MSETENPEYLRTNKVPEQYKPFSCTELTARQIEYARKHLNETEETRSKYLRRIKRFIDRELFAFSDTDDTLLLAFLRARRYDFKQTCLLMKKYAAFFQENSECFYRIDIEILRRIIASKAVGFLPYRDSKGQVLVLAKAENWDPDDLPVEDILFGTLIATHDALENPVNQIAGYVSIIDCNGFNFRQLREFMKWILYAVNNIKDCCPIILKEIHVINIPHFLLLGWNIVKPFVDENGIKLITFHETYESLHMKIPPCILPAELGGDLGPFSNDHWAIDLPSKRQNFFEKLDKIFND